MAKNFSQPKGGGAVLRWLLASFIAPPLIWFAFGLFLELWSLAEMLRILLSPWIWGYMSVFIGCLVFVARRQLGRIAEGIATGRDEGARASKAIRFLPLFTVVWMGIYCTVGPQIALLGQSLHDPFLDFWGYWLAEFLAIPLILLFTVPFFITMTRRLEGYAKPVALDPRQRFLSLRAKMVLSFVYNIIGSVLTLAVAAIALVAAGHGSPETMAFKLLATGLIVTLVSIGNLLLMIRQIVGPVAGLSAILSELFEAFAEGTANLGMRAEMDSRDEIGYLAGYFNSFLLRLASLVRSIQATVIRSLEDHEKLLAASTAMRGGMNELTEGSLFLKERFGELAGRVAEAGRSSAMMRERVETAASKIEGQGRDIGEGSRRMASMSTTIGSVSTTASEGGSEAAALATLAKKGGEDLAVLKKGIEGIEKAVSAIKAAVAVIQELGERTNLLAMNASIEAAHAGASGRGFAVVASEIRKLAENSQKSVAEISASIGTMLSSVEAAKRSATENGASFDRLFVSINQVCELLASMRAVLDGLAAEGRDLSASLGETARGALELTEEARAMKDLVRPIAATLGGMERLSAETAERMTRAVDRIADVEESLAEIERDGTASAEEGRRLHALVRSLKA
ncbi:MAG TPA: HAMP domain-containing methyl-accepting chemotaxis protein [Rectinemataceae bacterium]|nr:HAMP domain-containing methyl-accepting chemotaxis protein [Rectinemataceae bacterium]